MKYKSGRQVLFLEQRKGVGVFLRADTLKARASEQQIDPLVVDETGHRGPGHAHYRRVLPGRMDAEPAHLHQFAGIVRQRSEIVVFGRVAARNLRARAERHHPETTHQLTGPGVLDHHVAAQRVEFVTVEPPMLIDP